MNKQDCQYQSSQFVVEQVLFNILDEINAVYQTRQPYFTELSLNDKSKDEKSVQFLNYFLIDFFQIHQKDEKFLSTHKFIHKNEQEKVSCLYQPFVATQFLDPTCGYHAFYNSMIAIEVLQSPDGFQQPYALESEVLLWQFTFKVKQFLLDYAEKNQKTQDIWQNYQIHFRDFSRSYVPVCINEMLLFKNVYQDTPYCQIRHAVFQMQYNLIVNDNQQKESLGALFEYFKNFKTPDQHLVLNFLIGATCHWISMIAHKYNGVIEFFVFDSNNFQFLDWEEKQRKECVEFENTQRLLRGLSPLKPYQYEIYQMSLEDEKLGTILLCDFLLGNENLEKFVSNSEFEVFGKQLRLSFEKDDFELRMILETFNFNIQEYFFDENQVANLSKENLEFILKLVDQLQKIPDLSDMQLGLIPIIKDSIKNKN